MSSCPAVDHEDLEDQDLILLAEVPARSFNQVEIPARPQKKNTSIDTIETDAASYDFDIAYGRAHPDDVMSLSNEPIIRMKEEDYDFVQEEDGNSPPQWKMRLLIPTLCILVLIGIIVGAVVGTSAGASQGAVTVSQSNSQGVLTPSPSQPTGSPTNSAAPSVQTAFQIVADELSLVGGDRPTDVTASEYKAIDFLAGEYTASGELLSTVRLKQRYAMACLYFALGGPDWTHQLGFLSSQHECEWSDVENTLIKGAICDEANLKINYITLPNNNLTGTIPDQIGYFTDLQHLDLSFNTIGGPIPPGLATATLVQRVSLNSNQLTGTVPSFALEDDWKNLAFLSIERNFLTGDLTSLCVLSGAILRADCLGGNDAEVVCPCCRFCCSKDQTCSSESP